MKAHSKNLNCVACGGGTGLSTLLKGLKRHVVPDFDADRASGHVLDSLTAVVTVTDDGGSSGRLREEFQMLPPGDIRNCLVALSEDERLLSKLFQYRFPGEGEVRGHSFGNLFLAALTGVTGDFVEAVRLTSEVLAIRGQIVPSTTSNVTLVAEYDDGRIVRGESKITAERRPIRRLFIDPADCKPLPETLDAIKQADIITLGPGSLYTSIIPNLLVQGVAEAIAESRALKIHICNIMTQPGETDGFTVADHIEVLNEYLPAEVLDVVLVNTGRVSPEMVERYRLEGATPLYLPFPALDRAADKTNGSRPSSSPSSITVSGRRIPVAASDLLEESDVARHSPEKLARAVLETYDRFQFDKRQGSGFRVQGSGNRVVR